MAIGGFKFPDFGELAKGAENIGKIAAEALKVLTIVQQQQAATLQQLAETKAQLANLETIVAVMNARNGDSWEPSSGVAEEIEKLNGIAT